MSFDLEAIRKGYAELSAEFGEKGAAILAGIPIKFVESALNGEKTTYTEKIESLLFSRPKAYEFYQGEQRDLRVLISVTELPLHLTSRTPTP